MLVLRDVAFSQCLSQVQSCCVGSQVGAPAYLLQAMAELGRPGVRMVYSQAPRRSIACYSDIYNQVCVLAYNPISDSGAEDVS